MTAQQIAAQTTACDEEMAKGRMMKLLADTWASPVDNEEEEEITCVISNRLKLRCPLSFERVVIPVRGEQCMHLQCFGLQAYLESNMKMRALNNRWTCPVCNTSLRPQDLRVDGYVEKALSETPAPMDGQGDGQRGESGTKRTGKRKREEEAAKAADGTATEGKENGQEEGRSVRQAQVS